MESTIVDKYYQNFQDLINDLSSRGEVSLKNDADNNFKKILIIVAASYFENEVIGIIKNFVKFNSNNNVLISTFISKRALERRYHELFDWESKNANKFLGFFGDDFRKECDEDIKRDEELNKAIKDFMETGEIRNKLIHKNFGIYTIDITSDEIYSKYKSSINFVEFLKEKFKSS